MNEKIQWKYPIKGITESISNLVSYNFKTKSRVPLESNLKINLPGLPKTFTNEVFDLEISGIPLEFKNMLAKSLKIDPIKKTLEGIDDQLIYAVKFHPMKPFKIILDILVTIPTGGRWK